MSPIVTRPVIAAALVMLALPAAAAGEIILHHEARVVLDADAHTVEITDQVVLPAGVGTLNVGEGFEVVAPAATSNRVEDGDDAWQEIDLAGAGYGPGDTVLFTLRGTFHQPTDEVSFSLENVGGEITATIGDEGVYLSSGAGWLPWHDDALATHRVEVVAPEGFISVTQGRPEPGATPNVTTWNAPHPSDGLNLIANRFFVHEETVREGVTAMTFLLEDDARLRGTYLERTAAYIAMYEEMIGPYPYAKFATVENWFPTGYGMPSYTLLGGQVLRLPFIPYTSFGHEIAHNWWGNSVFVDVAAGNWCEGLTVWCADYHYKELESATAAREYRRNNLKDYHAYVSDPDLDFPLREFKSRHSSATRAVGYGKSMMVFHMLDQRLGRENFLTGLRRVAAEHLFVKASWDDFLATFADVADDPLDGFAEQWLDRTGAPYLGLENVEFGDDEVSFTLTQGAPVYDLQVPVAVTGRGDELRQVVSLDAMTRRFTVEAPGARRVAVDPDYDLFRRLDPREVEPTISQVLAEEEPMVLCPASEGEMVDVARAFGEAWTEGSYFHLLTGGNLPTDLPPGSVRSNLVLNPAGATAKLWRRPELTVAGKTLILEGKRYDLDDYDLVYTTSSPFLPSVTDLVVISGSTPRLEALPRRLSHYGKYSWLLLPAGQGRVIKGNWEPAGSALVAEATGR